MRYDRRRMAWTPITIKSASSRCSTEEAFEQYEAAYVQIPEENGAEKAAEKVVALAAAAAHTVLAFLQQHISPHSTIVIWAMNTAAISC